MLKNASYTTALIGKTHFSPIPASIDHLDVHTGNSDMRGPFTLASGFLETYLVNQTMQWIDNITASGTTPVGRRPPPPPPPFWGFFWGAGHIEPERDDRLVSLLRNGEREREHPPTSPYHLKYWCWCRFPLTPPVHTSRPLKRDPTTPKPTRYNNWRLKVHFYFYYACEGESVSIAESTVSRRLVSGG